MGVPPYLQYLYVMRSGGGNAAEQAYIDRVEADGGKIVKIGCVPDAIWDRPTTTFTGLLDLYPGAAAAYSVRQLSTSATLSMRVRKEVSTVSEETDIGFVNNELDTAALLAFASNADNGDVFVVTWYDQSGSVPPNNAINSTAASQPKIVSSGAVLLDNGKPSIEFDGTDDSLSVSFGTTYSQPNSIFTVCNKTDHAGYLFDGVSGSLRHAQGNSTWVFSGAVLSNAYPNTDLGSQVVFTSIFDGANTSTYLNGSNTITGNAGTQGVSGLQLGRIWNKAAPSLNGAIQEFIFYPSDQSSNRTGVESNINNYF